MKKPREFWIADGTITDFDSSANFVRAYIKPISDIHPQVHVIEYSAYKLQADEIEKLKAELNQKNESGCCIVEHGYRMEAEHRAKQLQAANKILMDALITVRKEWTPIHGGLSQSEWCRKIDQVDEAIQKHNELMGK